MDKVICVGKNYLKHALELGDAVPEEPLIFLKPPSVVVTCESPRTEVHWPKTGELHHEVELVLRHHGGRFTEYTVGLDLTLRDVQAKLKKAGQPWERGKVFHGSAVVGPFRKITSNLMDQEFSLKVNGEVRQSGFGRDMRWSPEALLESLRPWLPLCDGDLLFTGTPEGVGPLKDGDQLEVRGPDLAYQLICRRGGL